MRSLIENPMKDCHGNDIEIGDLVRVLEIDPGYLASLPEDEQSYIAAMLHNEFTIDGFPEEGKASISICIEEGDGCCFYGGLYMLSHEFELVTKNLFTI